MELEHWNEEQDGVLTEAAMRRKFEERGYAVNRYTYPPGTYFSPHTHDVDKLDGVLSGRFKLEMGGKSVILESGDALAIPKGAVHSAEVMGNESVISLDSIKYN
ncbi:cupin domain-containing protein [Candidatus Parabeggiatoa sp. HSG14]|uniref:cupin domain-containing protein n=1 Tax=Candidatus Parabeggiatoa sp. HSG14 TaxID=3055593 RepID=UPI0025A7AA79|nr:cupin domain-containing protein [Thiotrichales bacterium HSG14]